MDYDERPLMNEEARREASEILYECSNCWNLFHEHELISFKSHLVCEDCLAEVIALRHRIRFASQITKDFTTGELNT